MVQLSTAEHALVDDLLECLAIAIDQTAEIDPEYANKTKLQKLLYLAIDEFDLPLTYSWYLAGAIVPGDPVSPSGLQTAFDDVSTTDQPTMASSEAPARAQDMSGTPDTRAEDPVRDIDVEETVADFKKRLRSDDDVGKIDPILFSDTANTGNSTDPTSQNELGDRRPEVIDFYERRLPNVWHQNTMQFLQNFYVSHAPDEYRELYLQSTHLRTRLREVEETIALHVDGEETDQDIASLTKAVGLEISDLHYSIRKSDSLSATLSDVVFGTDLIEDGLMMLSQMEPEELTTTHREIVGEMQDLFYYWVWRLPCLIISQETATGPSAEILRSQRQEQLASFDERLRKRCREFERTLEQAGLKPAHTDYEVPDDDISRAAAELSEKYLE